MTDKNTKLSPSILLFGHLALSFDESALEKLRKTVLDSDDSAWLVDIISDLTKDCDAALSGLPGLQNDTGTLAQKRLADLSEAFVTGRSLNSAFPLPNSLLIPLVVAGQLAQYAKFLRQTNHMSSNGIDPWTTSVRGRTVLGLCTGLLAAFAAASAHNVDEFKRYGAAAVRLGLLVGLVIDSQDAASPGEGRSRSLSAAWTSSRGREDITTILNEFEGAYISVLYDEKRATITAPADSIPALVRRLQSTGVSATEIALFGCFHSESNSFLVDQLIGFCGSKADFQLPDATSLAIPTRANDSSASLLQHGALHVYALRSILLEPAYWFDTFQAAIMRQGDDNAPKTSVFNFGPDRSVPPSLLVPTSKLEIISVPDRSSYFTQSSTRCQRSDRTWPDSDIAVVGMSCKVPGAAGLEEFWDLLVEGRSQHREINVNDSSSMSSPISERFSFHDSPFRSADDAKMRRKWFANLIDGYDQFDHRFFKKSARESASMDPQQRHMLQVAYQAVEQSGYFRHEPRPDAKVGCFVGVCLGDYDKNVACHAANAFTATGNLQGFVSGRVSHLFGWTGPALTINTACSSSLVAVHQACHSILSGDCDAALAGGSHIMTSAEWFQNLAAGSFLSPTGQCKPFDAKADGYCRGEGVGAVFLKRMSKAVADGDPILGVIAATAVQQNQNCTPIFVPNAPSLSDLFTRVMAKARVKPSQISVVEAHGTGTAVGDPAEYDGIRKVLGGRHRGSGDKLMISSVKGLLGHMECTSGIISLIKVLLMINKGILPPQASFEMVNPALNSAPADGMFIPTRAQPWRAEFRAALINNYGASGSNASAIVLQAPRLARTTEQPESKEAQMRVEAKQPFWFSGFDEKSLRRYQRSTQVK